MKRCVPYIGQTVKSVNEDIEQQDLSHGQVPNCKSHRLRRLESIFETPYSNR